MSKKRSFESLLQIDDETPNAEVHFGVEMLSPVKTSMKGVEYYNAKVSDGSKKLRLVGFDSASQKELAKFVEKNSPIKASNCSIRKKGNDELEIYVNKGTQFTASPRKLTFEHIQQRSSVSTNIGSVPDIDDGTLVDFSAKVTRLCPPRDVSTGVLQEATLIDESGSITMSLWNKNVDKLKESCFYKFRNATVITFRNEKKLNYGYQSSHVEDENITNIEEDVKPIQNDQVELIGIQSFSVHYWCIHCDSRLMIENQEMSCCEKCHLLQYVEHCQSQITCKVLFQIDDESRRHILLDVCKVTFEALMKIASKNEDTSIKSDSDYAVMTSSFGKKFTITYIGHVLNTIDIV